MQSSLATKPRPSGFDVLRFRYLGPDDVEELADLWGALHQQRALIAPHLDDIIGAVDIDESWRRRRAQYVAWMAEPETLAVLAERADEPVGYAMVTIRDNQQGTWDRGDRVAVVQTLAIDPDYTGTGVGSGLMEELRRQLAAEGIRDIEFSALATSPEDIRFLEKEGFRPFVTTMICRIDGFGAHD